MSSATFGKKLVLYGCSVKLVYKKNSTVRHLKLGRCEDLGTNKMIFCDNIACFAS